jgi:NUMOD3 motif
MTNVSPEAREKMRQAVLGRRHSPETKAKIGASGKLNWRTRRRRGADLEQELMLPCQAIAGLPRKTSGAKRPIF